MNPYLLLTGIIAMCFAVGGAGWQGFRLGRDSEIAARAKQDVIVQASREAMQKTAAEAIAAIEVKHVTVRQQLETEIHEKPVYRECVADARGLQLINAALTGEEAGPARNSLVPFAPAADGPELRIDGSKAGGSGDSVPQVPGSGTR